MAKRSMGQRWNDAWDKWTVKLIPYRWNKGFLEGENEFSRDIIRRARSPGVIRNSKQYDDLLMTVSEWGYCVETPADFNFAK